MHRKSETMSVAKVSFWRRQTVSSLSNILKCVLLLPSDCVYVRYCNEIISSIYKIILQSRGRIVHCVVAKRPGGEPSRWRNVQGAKRSGGELAKGRNVQLLKVDMLGSGWVHKLMSRVGLGHLKVTHVQLCFCILCTMLRSTMQYCSQCECCLSGNIIIIANSYLKLSLVI